MCGRENASEGVSEGVYSVNDVRCVCSYYKLMCVCMCVCVCVCVCMCVCVWC